MRLFMAIHPPDGVLADLKRLQAGLLAGTPPVHPKEGNRLSEEGIVRPQRLPFKPTRAGQLHLTLQFLGNDITIHKTEEIRQKLKEVEPLPAPFLLSCIGAGAFPTPAKAQVAHASVESPELEPLACEIEHALLSLGIRRDKPLKPHITIARSKWGQDVSGWVAENRMKKWSEAEWNASSFSLMESSAELGGHEHRVLERYALRG